MNRRNKTIEWRNKEIYAEYIAHLRNSMPIMMAYAILANNFDLSEESIRKIVAEQSKRGP